LRAYRRIEEGATSASWSAKEGSFECRSDLRLRLFTPATAVIIVVASLFVIEQRSSMQFTPLGADIS
jgi:hypothetical protein